jgi:hypothetical protein
MLDARREVVAFLDSKEEKVPEGMESRIEEIREEARRELAGERPEEFLAIMRRIARNELEDMITSLNEFNAALRAP